MSFSVCSSQFKFSNRHWAMSRRVVRLTPIRASLSAEAEAETGILSIMKR